MGFERAPLLLCESEFPITLTIKTNGGKAPFSYRWKVYDHTQNEFINISQNNTPSLSGVMHNQTPQVRVVDSNGCISHIRSITVQAIPGC